ncbi:hypothetical protein RvY_11292 [Ramazzottius varieornatus]|uniref:Uncharacterized protein n=1 Tax=Ramazzottius varieornatus TaxID=947166 RepID=A0A1D1VFN6_RAMVA|nr:hypothetical protein RvY_11292 [Ramazzottius varieornatus]
MELHFPSFISSDDSNFGPLDTLISTHLQNGSLRIVYKRNITLNYIRNSEAYNADTNNDPGDRYKKWKRLYDFARTAGAVLRNMVVTVTCEPRIRWPPLPKQKVNVQKNNNLAWRLSRPVGIYHPIFDDIDDIPERLKETLFFSAVDKIFPHHEIQRRIVLLRAVEHDLTYFQVSCTLFHAPGMSSGTLWLDGSYNCNATTTACMQPDLLSNFTSYAARV